MYHFEGACEAHTFCFRVTNFGGVRGWPLYCTVVESCGGVLRRHVITWGRDAMLTPRGTICWVGTGHTAAVGKYACAENNGLY